MKKGITLIAALAVVLAITSGAFAAKQHFAITSSKQIKNGWDLTSLDHIFPCAIHRSSLPSLCSVSLKHCSLTRPRDKLRDFPAILPQKEHIRLLRLNMTIPR